MDSNRRKSSILEDQILEWTGWIMKYVTEQSNSFTDRKIKLECPTELLMLKTGVFCCLLDDVLTFCWGNSSFFTTIGHSEESFCSRFHDLRQYYAKFPN